MLVATAEAVEFANRIPKCLANIATSTCQIRFASEYGCNLQRDYMPACRRQFNTVKAQFARMPTTGKVVPAAPPFRSIAVSTPVLPSMA